MQLLQWPYRLKRLLQLCKDKASLPQIHALLITTALYTHPNSVASLISSYVRIGDIVSAHDVFDRLPHRRVDMCNSMVLAYSRKNNPSEVLKLYRNMIAEGVTPDSSTFTVALKACASLMNLREGQHIWSQAADFGYEDDVFVGSSVLNLYVKCGEISKAKVVFDKMVKKDVVCWGTMIVGYVQSGQASDAVDEYRRMQEEGIEADGAVMVGLIQASGNLGDLKLGLSIHGYVIKREMHAYDVVCQTSLVDMYAKNGYLKLASRVFEGMPRKNVVSWGALISGFAQNGFAINAFELLVQMQKLGFKPDSASLVNALSACSQIGHLKFGMSVHAYIVRRLDFDKVSYTALVDMYAKCGALACARFLFDQIDSKDLILWNAMIASYGIHGHGVEALSLFLKMRERNLKPDHATFNSLLSALSHSGMVEEGRYWFNVMIKESKIQPSEKHYVCMVDLFSRAGEVEKAFQLIQSMNSKPGLAIWVALLSGCHKCRKLSFGMMAAKKILDISSDDLGIYALVSNFFSLAKKWEEVAIVRKKMKVTGLRKVPGYSAVEVDGKPEVFLMEYKYHRRYLDIVQVLDGLDDEMKLTKDRSDTIFID
ncbi:hypothetical protein K2173_018802 [Erythroxylum novogranatense]|uniref:Pentatricopeptide repeat-containing protein n=1 Tax=Erythroxylum novogranatense TaxID=1862640 RepID=A0AAV8SAZ9_9ROSI|nr:hypothetical protein K2173_018802 [Erythroxylum novogranatense]